MTRAMIKLRNVLECGYSMRAQRMTEGLLLAGSFVFGDLRPAYVAFAMLAAQVLLPFAAPIALVWLLFDRRVPPDRLGNLYFDLAAVRGAAAISCMVLATAFALIHWAGLPALGQVLIGAPAASCILAATVGFCAGCGYYVVGRDLLVRAGILPGSPKGASDVRLKGV